MKRNRILGHYDLDGEAGALALEFTFPQDHNTTSFHTYVDIDQAIVAACTAVNGYDRILVVDICPDAPYEGRKYETPEQELFVKVTLPDAIRGYVAKGGQFTVLDHHGARTANCKAFYADVLTGDSILESKDANGDARAGSELAARYYTSKRAGLDEPSLVLAVQDWGRITGTYDTWRKSSPDWELGTQLAMGQSLMNDAYGTLRDMRILVKLAAERIQDGSWGRGGIDWAYLIARSDTCFARYVGRAPALFDDEVTKAKAGAIVHSPEVMEVYTPFFSSLVAEALRQENKAVVVMRYAPDVADAKTLSFRRHEDFDINLGQVLRAVRATWGGHAAAAGCQLDKPGDYDLAIGTICRAAAAHADEHIQAAA